MSWQIILKKPYSIGGTETPFLYQGSQSEEDTGYWTPYFNQAVVYAVYGSEVNTKKSMKDIGKPTIKQAKESKENIDLKDDPEKTMAGMGKLDYTLVSDKEVEEAIDELIEELEFVGYDDFERNGVNYALPEQFSQLMETTAQFYSNEDRIQHAKKMQEKLQ
tara:strand:+ start:90 stop:575 length:486 start_codon:yes stop_codon:yes gene_type:complete